MTGGRDRESWRLRGRDLERKERGRRERGERGRGERKERDLLVQSSSRHSIITLLYCIVGDRSSKCHLGSRCHLVLVY